MYEMDRASNFVSRQVEELIKRHREKLIQIYPDPDVEEILRASGNKTLIAAIDDIQNLKKNIERMEQGLEEITIKYYRKFKDTSEDLINTAMDRRYDFLTAKQTDFEFRIHKAIGLVELVSSTDAFNVLNDCRNEIEQMGK